MKHSNVLICPSPASEFRILAERIVETARSYPKKSLDIILVGAGECDADSKLQKYMNEVELRHLGRGGKKPVLIVIDEVCGLNEETGRRYLSRILEFGASVGINVLASTKLSWLIWEIREKFEVVEEE